MVTRRLFHYLCIFLLLVAQQGAIVHATWHAGGDAQAHQQPDREGHDAHEGHAQDHDASPELPAGQASLCAFDLAFGQVLGGVHGSCALPVVTELPAVIAGYTFNPRRGSDAVPTLSRGPPAFL